MLDLTEAALKKGRMMVMVVMAVIINIITLDLKHGGLGLKKVSEHANAAYIASVIANSSTIKDHICRNVPSGECAHLKKAVEDYNLIVGLSDGLCTPFPVVVTQKKLSSTMH